MREKVLIADCNTSRAGGRGGSVLTVTQPGGALRTSPASPGADQLPLTPATIPRIHGLPGTPGQDHGTAAAQAAG